MVHARAFSFTDDATSVALPSLPSTQTANISGNTLTGPHSLECALLLFQLRRAQSNWYQELFQSRRDPLQQSSTYIWEMCYEMRIWSESLPKTVPEAIRELFELELLYSYVYCLAPSCRVPAVSELGKTLIFEYSILYMEKISSICKDPINTAFYSYHDALRVYFIGSQFFAVLSANLDQLLNGVIPYVPATITGPPPPPIPNPGPIDNIDRSIKCIDQIIETLRTYGERWDDSKALQASFETQVGSLTPELRQRRQQRDVQSRTKSAPGNGPRPQQPPNEFDHLLNDNWMTLSQTFSNNMNQNQPGMARHHQSY